MMKLHILGTRGSAPTAEDDRRAYGGNTQCAVVEYGGAGLVLDAGSGIFAAAAVLDGMGHKGEYHILLSHYHMDHLVGLPMCGLLLRKAAKVHLYGMAYEGKDCETCLRDIFVPPLWPVEIADLPAEVHFHTLQAGQCYSIGGFRVGTMALNHPGGALGYRVEKGEDSLCYLFDHEQDGLEDSQLAGFIQGSGLLLCDAPFTEETYSEKRGFGHSSAAAMLRLAKAAGVRKTLLAHHRLDATDDVLDAMQKRAQADFPGLCLAYAKEGEVVVL